MPPVGERVMVYPSHQVGDHQWCPFEGAEDLVVKTAHGGVYRCISAVLRSAPVIGRTRTPSTITVPVVLNKPSAREGTAGAKTCSSAVSIVFRVRLMVGCQTPKSSAKNSSV